LQQKVYFLNSVSKVIHKLLKSHIWAIIVLILAIIPGNYIPEVQSFWSLLQWDKLIHLFLFAIFVMLLINDLRKQNKLSFLYNNSILFSLLIGTVFGLITETLQLYEPLQRNSNVYDFIADVIGCIIGIPLFYLIFKKK